MCCRLYHHRKGCPEQFNRCLTKEKIHVNPDSKCFCKRHDYAHLELASKVTTCSHSSQGSVVFGHFYDGDESNIHSRTTFASGLATFLHCGRQCVADRQRSQIDYASHGPSHGGLSRFTMCKFVVQDTCILSAVSFHLRVGRLGNLLFPDAPILREQIQEQILNPRCPSPERQVMAIEMITMVTKNGMQAGL